jgi:hypothetical protein
VRDKRVQAEAGRDKVTEKTEGKGTRTKRAQQQAWQDVDLCCGFPRDTARQTAVLFVFLRRNALHETFYLTEG